MKSKLKGEETFNIDELSEELFKDKLFEGEHQAQEDFSTFVKGHGLNENVNVDKAWIGKS